MTNLSHNLKINFLFEKIFCEEESILISFLNSTLKLKQEIISVDLKNVYKEKDGLEDSFFTFNMIATTSNKKAINVEIQLSNQKNIIKRTLYNWSRLYNKQIEEMYQNNEYSSPNKTIYINILNCNCLDTNKFHSTYRLGQVETNEELTDLEEIHFIEIPKLRELNLNDEADMLEVWIEFLRDPESEVIRNIEMSNEAVRKAKDKLYKLSQSKEDRELYF